MPKPRFRCSATLLFHAARRAVLLAVLAGLGNCSVVGQQQEVVPTAGADPEYVKFVADFIRTSFKTLSSGEGAEISEPRWVQSNAGWSWLACVHFQDRGHRRTYAVFFRGNQIVDSRYAVLTDHCNSQSYSPLDLMTGSLRQVVPGDPGPLY